MEEKDKEEGMRKDHVNIIWENYQEMGIAEERLLKENQAHFKTLCTEREKMDENVFTKCCSRIQDTFSEDRTKVNDHMFIILVKSNSFHHFTYLAFKYKQFSS